ncbi:MAG: sulfatase-like hydrolase/transferase [Oscillospiraceae bacterium]|jgi:arylsulfatase A-like enzyme|nr:sulfatase-like hydrolase/transferase [Oscillospiraceae bacterium]
MKKQPNILFLGIDSCRATRMSLCGYHRKNTPHLEEMARKGVNFTHCFSPSIPTPPGYSSLLTGRDCFGTGIVTLRNVPELPPGVTLQEVLAGQGYNSTCIGFGDGAYTHGFQNYIEYKGWGADRDDGKSHKAENLNDAALPELKRLAGEGKPFCLFLRHMDPHSPYLPPAPFDRMFYNGDECDGNTRSLDGLWAFKPFATYFREWFPAGCTDARYINAQYDGAVAYMDACIQQLFTALRELNIEGETIVVITSDHGETLDEHDCWYDHHGLYEPTLRVPLAITYPGRIPAGLEFDDFVQQKDVMPTLLELLGVKTRLKFDGRSLSAFWTGARRTPEPEFYLTEATWMRKHGWRTPEWKLIAALEPDLHFKPAIELYNLVQDPLELDNVAEQNPEVVAMLQARMDRHIAARKKAWKTQNPVEAAAETWNGLGRPYASSEEAYNDMFIGNPDAANKLQAQKK